MNEKDELIEKVKEELQHRVGEAYFPELSPEPETPVEAIASMGANVTTGELIAELERRGFKVIGADAEREQPKAEKVIPEPTAEDLAALKLNPAVENTPENQEHYWKLREEAQEKLGDSGMIQSYLENAESVDPNAAVDESALNQLNTASYQGNFGELKELSRQLKKED